MIKVCTKYRGRKTENIINWFGAYKYSEYMDAKCARDLILMDFEGYEFKVPAAYQNLLHNMYGDYMKLPPPEKRGNQHAMINVSLGGYVPKCKK